MAATNVSIRLGVEGKAEVKRAFDEVGQAGTSAFRGVASAMDAAGSATDRQTQRLQRLAQAARQAASADQSQRHFNAVLGVGTTPKSARESADVFESTAKASEDLERRTAALRAQIDPLGAAQKRLNAEIAEATALLKAGAITEKEHTEAIALAKDRFDLTAGALSELAQQSNLTGGQIRALIATFRLASDAATTGEVPLGRLTIQALKLGKAFGAESGGISGIFGGVGRVLASVITPARLAAGAVAGIAIAGTTAYDAWIKGQKQLEVGLFGAGRAAGATVADLNRIAEAGAAAGRVSVAAARDMETAFLRTGRIGKDNFADLIAVAKNYAVTVGSDVDAAVKTLTEAFADPVRGADQLNAQLGFLDDKTRAYIRRLAEQNDRTGAQRVLLEAMRGSLANAETATTALGRAWDAVKRSASDAYDALGRAIDRAAGGGTPDDQLARIEQRLAALSRGSNSAPSRVLAELRRQADDLRTRIADARHQADLGRIEAEARELSLKVGEAVRDIVPGTSTIRQLETLRGSLGKLLEDPLAARNVDNLKQVEDAYRRVTQALTTYSGENAKFVDPQARKLRLQQIEIELVTAIGPARRAALEAERARIELIGQTVTPEQAALTVEQARNRVLAEAANFLRDTARDQRFSIEQTQAEIAFVGKSVEEKDKFIARLKAEQDLRRQGISAASAEGQIILANAERQAALNAQLDRARELTQGWQSVFESSMNRFSDLIAQGKLDWQSWADAGRAAITDLNKELMKLTLLNPLKNLLFGTNAPTLSNAGGLFGNLFSGLFSGGSGIGPVAAGAKLFGSPIYHFGGIVGGAAPLRTVPADTFHNVPRFHGGAFLSPDEVPAILQRGERVLSRSEAQRYGRERAVAAPVVNVTIQTPSPAAFQASRSQLAADLARAVRMGARGL
jgi:phage-related minor tail protein